MAAPRAGPLARLVVAAVPSLEAEMLRLPAVVRRGDLCVDVGASYGTYTVALARLAGREGEVHAFEPRPRSRAVLRAATTLLAPGNVEIHALALADRAGEDVIVTPRRRWLVPVPGRTFLRGDLPDGYDHDGEFGGATERRVATDSLDAFAARRDLRPVGFVKIDVEGAELKVLQGAERTLTRDRPVVLCEIEDRHTRKYGHRGAEVAAWLSQRGWQAHIDRDGALQAVSDICECHNNYLFLPRGGAGGVGGETTDVRG